ncbi:hypothetical protein BDEG_28457 [Batrachochytrium dendrobatidis JEL423]|uniref:L domain-like protein n=1 Tax=Batrachochytrium dendrobatidis (strain JEL423) TaxID=403673 RepID=A0A177WZ06_BATDL|nr:hypothetical protein BDEG_28457 [Batrachochytrium dendrobatidis JEL423]
MSAFPSFAVLAPSPSTIPSSEETAPKDCAALQAIFPTVVLGSNCCTYAGITCLGSKIVDLAKYFDDVYSLKLNFKSDCHLSALNTLNLSGNIPPALTSLDALESLYLHENAFTGEIPSSFGNFTKLQNLWLFKNMLVGSIPSSLGDIKSLQSLHIENNQLSGTIPSSLTTLPTFSHFKDNLMNMYTVFSNTISYFGGNTNLTGQFPSGGFSGLIDCNSAGTSVCIGANYVGQQCGVPFCVPQATGATNSMTASPAPTSVLAAANSSSTSGFNITYKIATVAAAIVVMVTIIFFVMRYRKRRAYLAAQPPASSGLQVVSHSSQPIKSRDLVYYSTDTPNAGSSRVTVIS